VHSLLPQLRPSAAAYLCHPVDGLPVALSQNLCCLQVPLLRARRARAALLCALERGHRTCTAPAPACGSSRRSTASGGRLSGRSGWRPARAPPTPPRSCLRRTQVFAVISPYTAHTSESDSKQMWYSGICTTVVHTCPCRGPCYACAVRPCAPAFTKLYAIDNPDMPAPMTQTSADRFSWSFGYLACCTQHRMVCRHAHCSRMLLLTGQLWALWRAQNLMQ